MTVIREAAAPVVSFAGGMGLDPTLLLLIGFLAGAGFVLLLRLLFTRYPRSPAGWDPIPPRAVTAAGSAPPVTGAAPSAGSAAARVPPESAAVGLAASVASSETLTFPRIPHSGADPTEARADRVLVPAPESQEAARPRPDPSALRLSQRVVLHLQRQPRITRFDLAPRSMTQAGMAESLDATQSALAKVLARLGAAGVLSEQREHVQGEPRRLKVYQLTPVGEALARDVRRRLPAGARGSGAAAEAELSSRSPSGPRSAR